MCQNRIVTLGQAALLAIAAAGCTGFPSLRSSSATTPLGATKPGPIKQFANAVSDSKFGKSVSSAFQPKKATYENNPTSLAAGIPPTKPSDYVTLGETLDETGDGESARRMFHKALDMEPHHLGALVALGRHFDRQGQFDRASECYEEATKYHPSSATAFNDMGMCQARQRRYDEAVRSLQRAIELEPDRILYRNNIAMVLVAQNRINEALAHLTDAHGPAIAHYNLGCLLGKQGHVEEALNQFKLALAKDPNMESAQEWIAALTETAPGDGQAMLAQQEIGIEPAVNEHPTQSQVDEIAPRGRQNVAAREPSARPVSAAANIQPLPPVESPTLLR
ncbi:MAG TPA: tetratricopeptide repeat protein [Pirellulales bacterium]|nr:tetratricopeptide repeat protein [Pirellulales bacterium]